ncbi:unnamed protein product, partial [Discosporangium mesarthrocarpum]
HVLHIPLSPQVSLERYCPALECLDLSFCRAITNEGLGFLVDSSKQLKTLQLWGCTQIGDKFLRGHCREELILTRR